MKLWYETGAEFFEEALPLGNGHTGAMVYGGVRDELIELNHDTLWSGFPKDGFNTNAKNHVDEVRQLINEEKYEEAEKLVEEKMLDKYKQSYMPLGNIRLQFRHNHKVLAKKQYKRWLDISNATAGVEYLIDDTKYVREAFVSNPHKVGVLKISAKGDEYLEFVLSMDSKLKHNVTIENDNTVVLQGVSPEHIEPSYTGNVPSTIVYGDEEKTKALKFASILKVKTDGYIANTGACLLIRGAKEAIIIFGTDTTYNGYEKNNKNIEDVINEIKEKVILAENKGFEYLKEEHVNDYKRIFDRVKLDIKGENRDDLPTNQRIFNFKNNGNDTGFVSLYFQYSRYLMIASSRMGSQPANLQGIWNYEMRAPWSSNYTTNINAQMNYWLAESCNLSDCHQPLLNMIEELSKSGTKTAKDYYGCRGWSAAHNVDLWRCSTPVAGNAGYAFWPMGGAWLCRHIWEHYRFTLDNEFLKKSYPVLKGAAEFCLDWLIQDETGYLLTSPATSPENSFVTERGNRCSVSKGTTMDMAIIRELFTSCIQSSEILDIDKDFSNELKSALYKLYPYKIGKYGQLQEWYKDFDEYEPGHRHVSHLYGLYPSDTINESTLEFVEACRKSLERRLNNGGGHTGWSCAWIINLWARLKDSQKAYEYVKVLLTRSSYPNLFDAHPPFQIDGNFGGTAGIAEMLIQSHEDYIEILPALPKEWNEGCVKGLCARGGYEVDIKWENGELKELSIKSKETSKCKVKYKDEIKEVSCITIK